MFQCKLVPYNEDKGLYTITGVDFQGKLKKIAEGGEFVILKVPSRTGWAGIGERQPIPTQYVIWDKKNCTYEVCDLWKKVSEANNAK